MTAWKTRVGATLPRAAIVVHDLFMVWLCWVALNQFRWYMELVSLDLPFWSPEVLLILYSQGLVFWQVGLYRGVWRFASQTDLLQILKSRLSGPLELGRAWWRAKLCQYVSILVCAVPLKQTK